MSDPVRPILGDSCCSGLGAAMSQDDAAAVAARFKALADPTRVQLLHLVAAAAASEACVCDLTDAVGLSQPTVSHHLAILVRAGLLRRERRGTWAWYTVDPERFDALEAELAGLRRHSSARFSAPVSR